MIRLFALWLALAGPAAAEPPVPEAMVQVMQAVERANAGDRKGAVKLLDGVLKVEPDNVDARVARGVSRYFLGDLPGAKQDLAAAFEGGSWSVTHVESQTGADVTVTRMYLDLAEMRRVGAGILVVLAAREGRLDEGHELVKKSTKAFGPHAEGSAAAARLALAEGLAPWPTLEPALEQPDPTRFVESVVSEMVALQPESVPQSVSDWLKSTGQWTAHYNAAIGAFRKKDYATCVREAAGGLAAFPDQPKMLSVGYPCAARADLQRAAVWLEALGGAKRAEPWSVLAHARSLKDARRPDEALGLLDGLPAKLPGELPAQVETLRLDILLAAKDLDRALKACSGAAPVAELGVGYALIQAKRLDEAHGLLKSVCPALKGTTSEPTCQQYLEYAAASR